MNPESEQTAASAASAPWRRRYSAVLLADKAAQLREARAAGAVEPWCRAGADVSALDLEIAN